LTFIDQNDKIALEKLLIQNFNQEKGEEIMGSVAEQLLDEGFQKGIQDGIQIGEAKGEARGEAVGKVKGKTEVARNLLSQNIDIKTISAATGLSIADIKKLENA